MADDTGGAPPFYESVFQKWSRTRGPLFERPAEAVCRILALCEVSAVRTGAPERAVRMRAARILGEALAPVPDSRRPATSDQRARVNRGLVDISRLIRETPPGEPLVNPVAKILAREGHFGSDPAKMHELDIIGYLALAELLVAAMTDKSWELSLRAARTLLARTRDAARRVGRAAQPDSPEDDRRKPETDAPAPAGRGDSGGSNAYPTQQSYECSAENAGRAPP